MKEQTNTVISALSFLSQQAPALGVCLTADQMEVLHIFLTELAIYNEHTNLVSSADPMRVVREHILDALSLVQLVDRPQANRLVDIGSGAGFPALILALLNPTLSVCLIESVSKKTRFLHFLTEKLQLTERVQVITGRAEELAHKSQLRGTFATATARAVGAIDLVLELALPFLLTGGLLLSQKSAAQVTAESSRAAKALPLLGGQLKEVRTIQSEPLGKEHVVFIIEKTSETPERYPRTTAQIKRSPLGGSALP